MQWWFCCAVLLGACVEPGELENKAQFEGLFSADGGPLRDGGASGRGGSGSNAGTGASPTGDGGQAMSGCPEACNLIATRCATAGCHSAMNPAQMLDLASPNIATRLANKMGTSAGCTTKKLFVEGSPAESMIYGKLLNPPACGTTRMPLGNPLKDDEIACMMRWVSNPVCGDEMPRAGSGGARAGSGGMGGTRAGSGGSRAGSGGAGSVAEPPSGSTIWIEAEDAESITAPMERGEDDAFSGGAYITTPMTAIRMSAPTNDDGIATYTFEITEADTYRFWGRVQMPDAEANSFWVKIDDGNWIQWNNIEEAMTNSEIAFGELGWDDIHNTNTMMVVQQMLGEGEHTLQIGYREQFAQLDKILITNDTNLTPTGEGE